MLGEISVNPKERKEKGHIKETTFLHGYCVFKSAFSIFFLEAPFLAYIPKH